MTWQLVHTQFIPPTTQGNLLGRTAGLDLVVMALDLEAGDEVIVPAINFKAAHYAVIGQGGQVILCEADPQTLNA